MSQTQLTSYFPNRKRRASDAIASSKSKIAHLDAFSAESKIRVLKGEVKVDKPITSTIVTSCKSEDNHEEAPREPTELISSQIKDSRHRIVDAFAKKVNATNVVKNTKSNAETLKTARTELNLGDIKKKLMNSSRFAELKERAEHISKGIQQLKESSGQSSFKKNLKEFSSIDVEVPASPSKTNVRSELLSPKKNVEPQEEQNLLMSPRKVMVSPAKSPRKVPEYMKLPMSPTSLPLPYHYRFLGELFRAMETVVSLLYNRNEKITFAKLKPSVQEMLKRNFTEKHLSQIKNLVPDFYNFEMQKCKNFATSMKKDSFDLVVNPNLPNEITVMNPTILLERRRYFYDTLLQLLKKHHTQFLLTLDPPMSIPDEKLVRWHPEFDLEKTPEVECAKLLPALPNTETYSTAQDVLAKARELFKCNTKMERAMEKLAQAKARGLTEEEKAVTGLQNNGANSDNQRPKPSTDDVVILNPALRNLPASLLEKVKAKQAAKALEAMTRSTEDEKLYLVYSRLPELARTLRNVYVTERKNVLALNVVLSKLHNSFRSRVSSTRIHDDIKVLCEKAPEWVQLHIIRNVTYLKLDRAAKIQEVASKLESLAEKFKP